MEVDEEHQNGSVWMPRLYKKINKRHRSDESLWRLFHSPFLLFSKLRGEDKTFTTDHHLLRFFYFLRNQTENRITEKALMEDGKRISEDGTHLDLLIQRREKGCRTWLNVAAWFSRTLSGARNCKEVMDNWEEREKNRLWFKATESIPCVLAYHVILMSYDSHHS